MATLHGQFSKGVDLYNKIDSSSLSSTDPAFQSTVAEAVELFTESMKMIRDLALFSTNELVEDIGTTDLQFLLVEAYLGELVPKVIGGDRVRTLEASNGHWTSFLTTLENYGLLDEEHRTLFKRIADGTGSQAGSARRREEVIARHRRKQQLEEDINTLNERKAKGIEADDELERELHLAVINQFVELALENLEMAEQEISLLKSRPALPAAAGVASNMPPTAKGPNNQRYTGPLLSSSGKPLTNFTLVSDRQRLQQKVFGPDHSLPTMSIEEYLEKERERGNIISGGGQKERPEKKVADDNDFAAVDTETLKLRAWDDWKDDNPRGHGNRKGKG